MQAAAFRRLSKARLSEMTPVRIVFVGPPGSGKGTQGALIASEFHISHLSTGEMLRERRDQLNDNCEFASYTEGSILAPDALMMDMVADRLSKPDCQSGWLMDGFPRTLVQAQLFDDYLKHHGDQITRVIELVADAGEIAKRLVERSKLENRVDDTPENIAKRLKVYGTRTKPVLSYYRDHDLVTRIDAMQDVDSVFSDIKDCIDKST